MKTYLDSGVLIAAFRAEGDLGQRALKVLDDETNEFVSSVFVKLETLPKATCLNRSVEVEFYQTFFESVGSWAQNLELIVEKASYVSRQYGLAAMDDLHIAAAMTAKAEEFVTTKRITKPMFRVTKLRVE